MKKFALKLSHRSSAYVSICVLAAVITGCGDRPSPGGDPSQPGAPTASGQTEHSEDPLPSQFAAGAKVYAANCELCHHKGEEGAPRTGNPLQWDDRVAKGQATLTKHAIEGFEGNRGEMPPQGDHLSDEEVDAAVKYMLFRYEAAVSEKN